MVLKQVKVRLSLIALFLIVNCTLMSCQTNRVHYSDCNRLDEYVYMDGSKFSGRVWAYDENSYLEVQNGRQIAIIGLYENGGNAFKIEFYSPSEMIVSGFSTGGELLYRQSIKYGFRHRPELWDFSGKKIIYENINSDINAQNILDYFRKNIKPKAEEAQRAYQTQLNKASY